MYINSCNVLNLVTCRFRKPIMVDADIMLENLKVRKKGKETKSVCIVH